MIFSCWRMLVLSLLDVCLRLAPQNITWFDFKQEQINFRHGVGVLHFLWLPLQIFLSILLCLDFLIHKIKIKITAFGLIFEIKKISNICCGILKYIWLNLISIPTTCIWCMIPPFTPVPFPYIPCLDFNCALPFNLFSSSCTHLTLHLFLGSKLLHFSHNESLSILPENMLSCNKIFLSLLLVFAEFLGLESSAELINAAYNGVFIHVSDLKNAK